MPDPLSIIRLAALLAFIGLVAVGLWLLDVAWWVVPPVMALALFIAWTIEWLAWRGTLATTVVRETATAAPPALPPALEEPPLPVQAIVPLTPPAPPARPEPEPQAVNPPPPEPQAPAEAAGRPEPEEEPPSEPESAPAEAAIAEPELEKRARRPRRMRLRPVPAAPPQGPAEAPPPMPPAESPVVALPPRTAAPRSWNLWDLERIARDGVRTQPERREEWSYLFLNLRQFAAADGSLPAEFDGLVRESFGRLLERAPGA